MSKAAEIRKRHKRLLNYDLEQLQKDCPHEKISEWMEEWWAPGHTTGYVVKRCLRCEKEMGRHWGYINRIFDKKGNMTEKAILDDPPKWLKK